MAARRPEMVDYLADVFAPLGEIETARLFGGWQLRTGGRPFAFVTGGTLYFRAAPALRPALAAAGSRPFSYAKRNGSAVVVHRLMTAPEADLEDEDALRAWAVRALAAEP